MGARGVMVVWLWGLFLLHVLAGEYLLITRGREIDDTCTVLRSFFGVQVVSLNVEAVLEGMDVIATTDVGGMARLGGKVIITLTGEDFGVESESSFKVRLECRGVLACHGTACLCQGGDDGIASHADGCIRAKEEAFALHRFECRLSQLLLRFSTLERYLRLCSHASPSGILNFELKPLPNSWCPTPNPQFKTKNSEFLPYSSVLAQHFEVAAGQAAHCLRAT
jgi:hypothetical protein